MGGLAGDAVHGFARKKFQYATSEEILAVSCRRQGDEEIGEDVDCPCAPNQCEGLWLIGGMYARLVIEGCGNVFVK